MYKQESRTKHATLNIAALLLMQALTAVSGLILPRLIISSFGSETNGLISSIAQFLSYISLLEGGVGGVIAAALYKPLYQKNRELVSDIMSEAQRFYRKLGLCFLAYIFVLCVLYPLFISTDIDRMTVVLLVLVISTSTLLEYFFALQYAALFTADQRARVTYLVSSVTVVLNVLVTWSLLKLHANIVYVKLGACFVFALKPVLYLLYVRRHYSWLSRGGGKTDALKQRWNGFAHHIAYFIHSSAPVTIITLTMGVEAVSVYAIYFAIVSGIRQIVMSISKGSAAGIGNLIAQDKKEETNRVMELYEWISFFLSTIIYTITALMLIPFIRIYLANVTDVNYIQPMFGYLMIGAEFLYGIRCIYSAVTSAAGHFKQTQNGAFIEAGLNIAVSLVLVKPFGLAGVAGGTLCAMLFRTLYEVLYLKRHILYRPLRGFFKNMLLSSLIVFCTAEILNVLFDYSAFSTWGKWVLYAMLTTIAAFLTATGIYAVFCWSTMRKMAERFLKFTKQDRG